ncbi:phosphate regulon sensor histidine kinase PhoR [Pigmentiphaga sp. NML080357]|uniref:phosphate regulon sensor histidine kinase PhoR n=1 Tax=Pigmentiphaga sp. NML080357 TaxID=2008675 RepID=UPI000B40B592|nr:phosphate regulon sensor histidine kinase PhoR [Pigmentiphaga sp. NML080357]OVZ59034.1 phosphate regulon sensor histidine kinase PhoR [Pigmentiphaga sp. NML080357]
MVWIRNLIAVLVWAGLAALSRPVTGNFSWAVFSFGLGTLLAWHIWQLSRVVRWTRDLQRPPPPSAGLWDEALARIYRHLRSQERQLALLEGNVQGFFAAAQALPDGLVTLDEEFHIDWCNRIARQHLGLRLPADRGQNLLNLVRAPAFVDYARQEDWPAPLLVRSPGGGERLLMVQLISYNKHQRMLLTRDVTQIEKLETTRRDFVANVSHELRTPLTVLAGFLETLRDMPPGALSDEQREQYLKLMLDQAQRMQAIVADLLTLSTLESSPTTDPQPVNMPILIETALSQARALSGGRHAFASDIDADMDVLGTATEISSAISNLIINAVRYTPDDGHITVSWRREADGSARYAVKDTGIGIAAQHLPRLTERFYRVDRSRSRESGGTGLGLAITKHIAMRHEAELDIASELGQGSTFSLRFPESRVVAAEHRTRQ